MTQQQAIPKARLTGRRIAVCVAVAATLAGYFAYAHLTNPARIRMLAETYLQQYVTGRVTVGSANFSWRGGIRLFDVAVVPQPDLDEKPSMASTHPVFACREVHLVHKTIPALLGSLKITSILATEPILTVVRDAITERTNLRGLFRVPEIAPTNTADWPIIELNRARLRVFSLEHGVSRQVDNLSLTLRSLPSKNDPYIHDVTWRSVDAPKVSGHSQIDVRTGALRNVEGGLPAMKVEAVMLAIDAGYDGVGAWYDLLGLDGTVRATDYDLHSGDGADRSATIELAGAAISIPIDREEQKVPPEDRFVTFEHVEGKVRLTGDAMYASFTGRLHDSPCQVEMVIRTGVNSAVSLEDVEMDIKMSLTEFTLPRRGPDATPSEARLIRRFPPLAHFYDDYDPHGVVDVEIDVGLRPGQEQPVTVRRVKLTARQTDSSCRFFPYRVTGLSGVVEYAPEGVFLRNLQGRHGAGRLSVDGWLAAPKRWAEKELTIKGWGIPIDEALTASLSRRYATILDTFNPTGTIDVEVHLAQPQIDPDEHIRWATTTDVTLLDVSATYTKIPYPVEGLTGRLTFGDGRVVVDKVDGRAGAGEVTVDGTVSLARERVDDIDLAVRGTGLVIDDQLLTALPKTVRDRLAGGDISGAVDFESSVDSGVDVGSVTHTTTIRLRDADYRPDGMQTRIAGLEGTIVVTGDQILVQGVTGKVFGGRISAEGSMPYGDTDAEHTLMVRTEGLSLNDDTLRAELPEALRRTLSGWRIEGPVSTVTFLPVRGNRKRAPSTPTTIATLDGAALTHEGVAVSLTDVRAEVTFDKAGVRATDTSFRIGDRAVTADVAIERLKQGERGRFRVSAKGLPLDGPIGQLQLDGWTERWKRWKPTGTVDLEVSDLSFEQADDDAPRVWTVSAVAELQGVSVGGVIDNFENLSGTVMGRGMILDPSDGASLMGELALDKLDAFGHPLSALSGQWSFARVPDGTGMFSLQSACGELYGGTVAGRLDLSFDNQQSTYDLSTMLQGMRIESFIAHEQSTRDATQPSVDVRGVAAGRLCLTGTVGDASTTRGRGHFEINEAQLYRLPLILAILNVLNVTAPTTTAFSDALLDFYVTGNRLTFDDIRLRGDLLALTGRGTLSVPDRGVDFELYNVNPDGWVRVPVLTDVVEQVGRELVRLHVTGPLYRPEVHAKPLRGLTEEFKRLFRKRKPKTGKSSAS